MSSQLGTYSLLKKTSNLQLTYQLTKNNNKHYYYMYMSTSSPISTFLKFKIPTSVEYIDIFSE